MDRATSRRAYTFFSIFDTLKISAPAYERSQSGAWTVGGGVGGAWMGPIFLLRPEGLLHMLLQLRAPRSNPPLA